MRKTSYFLLASSFLIVGCGGSGGSSNGAGSGGVSNSQSGPAWEILADISANGCKERISAVRQRVVLDGDTIGTGIISVPTSSTSNGFTFGFSDSIGSCNRNYTGEFSNVNGSTANVKLVSQSNCGGAVCENQWTGTATQLSE